MRRKKKEAEKDGLGERLEKETRGKETNNFTRQKKERKG